MQGKGGRGWDLHEWGGAGICMNGEGLEWRGAEISLGMESFN